MISPKELRLGNWVMGRQRTRMVETSYPPGPVYDEPASPVQVREIYHDNHGLAVNRQRLNRTDHTEWVELEPIPLTPVLLEKCGFKNKSQTSDYLFEYGDFIIGGSMRSFTPSVWGEDGLQAYGRELHYLHDLQNSYFAITGQELAISL